MLRRHQTSPLFRLGRTTGTSCSRSTTADTPQLVFPATGAGTPTRPGRPAELVPRMPQEGRASRLSVIV